MQRLDEERLETLREWGQGLSTNARDELRAAGKAILMLVDEVDRLQADVWHARAAATQRGLSDSSEALAATLSERISRGRAQTPTEPA